MRAETIRETYKRHYECVANLKPRKFLWESPEVSRDAASLLEALLTYVEAHLLRSNFMDTRTCLSETEDERRTQANRSSGNRHTAWMELNEAVRVEFIRTEREIQQTARADDQNSAQAQKNLPVPRYMLDFSVEVLRLELEHLLKDFGVCKLTFETKEFRDSDQLRSA